MSLEAATTTNGRTPYQQAARELLRDSLLDAAGELMNDAPWTEISMAAIATRAGVSRQTLYNEFGSRDEFAQHYAIREADRFLTIVETAIADDADDPHRAIYNGFLVFLLEAQNNPMVRHIVVRDPGADELLSLFTTRGAPVVELATARLAAKVLELWPQAEAQDARTLAEGLVRLGISYAGLPISTPEKSADQIVSLIAPFVDKALDLA